MKKFKLGLADVLIYYTILKEVVPFLNDTITLVEKVMSYLSIALNYFDPRLILTNGKVGTQI